MYIFLTALIMFTTVCFGGVSAVGQAITTAALALGVIAAGVRTFQRTRLRPISVLQPDAVGWLFFLWIVVLLFSTIFSVNTQASVAQFMTFCGYFGVFVLVTTACDREQIAYVVRVLFWFGCVFAVFGVVAFMMQGKIGLFQKVFYHGRLTATFINPNHCASFLGMIIPGGGYLIYITKHRGKVLYILGTICMIAAFMLTGSWAAYLAAIVAIGMTALSGILLSKKKKQKSGNGFWATHARFAGFLLGFSFLVVCAGILLYVVMGRGVFAEKSFSVWERGNLYRGIIALLTAQDGSLWGRVHTLAVGGGLGCFRELFHGAYSAASVSEFMHAHNEYLELLLETGVGGLSLFLAMLLCVAQRVWRYSATRKHARDGYQVRALMASIIFVLMHSVFDFPLRIPANGLLFFVLLAALVVLVRDDHGVRSKKTQRTGQRAVVFYSTVVVVACGMLVYAGQTLLVHHAITQAEKHFVRHEYSRVEGCFAWATALAHNNPELVRARGEYYAARAFSREKSEWWYYERLCTLYEDAIARNPRVPDYYLRMAWARTQGQEFDRAEDYFNAAIQLNPQFLVAYLQRAHFYLLRHDLEQASRDYRFVLDALAVMPPSPESKANVLVAQMDTQLRKYPLHPALREVYAGVSDYYNRVGR